MINALCIDLEPWYSAELLKDFVPDNKDDIEDQIVESVTLVLDLLNKYQVKATFAVLGIVAEKHPELIRNIFENEHEIASHAYSHKTLYELGEEGFEDEVKKSVIILESITGRKPVGFRAPSFSLNNSTIWALKILQKYGFKYDASIFPFKTHLYGVPDAPINLYKPSNVVVAREDSQGEIIEFPATVVRLLVNIPVSGGFYFRAIPLDILKWSIKTVNRTRPAILYIHPWEMYPLTPVIKKMPWQSRFLTYYARDRSLAKFEELLKTFKFAPVNRVIEMYSPFDGNNGGYPF